MYFYPQKQQNCKQDSSLNSYFVKQNIKKALQQKINGSNSPAINSALKKCIGQNKFLKQKNKLLSLENQSLRKHYLRGSNYLYSSSNNELDQKIVFFKKTQKNNLISGVVSLFIYQQKHESLQYLPQISSNKQNYNSQNVNKSHDNFYYPFKARQQNNQKISYKNILQIFSQQLNIIQLALKKQQSRQTNFKQILCQDKMKQQRQNNILVQYLQKITQMLSQKNHNILNQMTLFQKQLLLNLTEQIHKILSLSQNSIQHKHFLQSSCQNNCKQSPSKLSNLLSNQQSKQPQVQDENSLINQCLKNKIKPNLKRNSNILLNPKQHRRSQQMRCEFFKKKVQIHEAFQSNKSIQNMFICDDTQHLFKNYQKNQQKLSPQQKLHKKVRDIKLKDQNLQNQIKFRQIKHNTPPNYQMPQKGAIVKFQDKQSASPIVRRRQKKQVSLILQMNKQNGSCMHRQSNFAVHGHQSKKQRDQTKRHIKIYEINLRESNRSQNVSQQFYLQPYSQKLHYKRQQCSQSSYGDKSLKGLSTTTGLKRFEQNLVIGYNNYAHNQSYKTLYCSNIESNGQSVQNEGQIQSYDNQQLQTHQTEQNYSSQTAQNSLNKYQLTLNNCVLE